MRKHARYFYVLFIVVILSFIFWGVGTVDKSSVPTVVEIGKDKITAEEYWRAYDQVRTSFRETYKDKFNEEFEKKMNLKDLVLNSMISELILSKAASDLGITITDKELQDIIMNNPMFKKDGVFNQDVYFRRLQIQRQTPEMFENYVRQQLLSQKMKQLVEFSAEVNPLAVKDTNVDDKAAAAKMQEIIQHNNSMAIESYVKGLSERMHLKINRDIIS